MLLCRVTALTRRGLSVRRLALSFSSAPGAGVQPPADYRDSVLLPRTQFPMKTSGQKLLDVELRIQR
ncbi:isoleucine--tRNA ligase, mitochondrial, partial [Tachysurus ichikawai]